MFLRKVEPAPCYPITLEEARRHLAVDASTRDMDVLIDMLIASATSDAELKTSCVWVSSVWEWEPTQRVTSATQEPTILQVGVELEFPIIPVTKVQVFDRSEVIPEGGEPTDISDAVCTVKYPSLEPQGSPLVGSLLPTSDFPSNYKILLTAGYPVDIKEIEIEQKDNPYLEIPKITYTSEKIHLVFNRAVSGVSSPTDFTVMQNMNEIPVEDIIFEKDGVTIAIPPDILEEGAPVFLNFIGGFIHDKFDNYVQVITNQQLPEAVFTTEDDFVLPEPLPTQKEYKSNAPAPVKQWILVRTGTLYSQRTEIALRAGKSNDAMYPDSFINNLLNPYRRRFA